VAGDKHFSEWVAHPTGKIPQGAYCTCCGRYNARHITVSVIPVVPGKVLLTKRAKDPQAGFWCFPGGYVEWNETVDEAAVRELGEETHLEAEAIGLLGVYSDPQRDLDGRQNIECSFVAQITAEANVSPNAEVQEAQWFDWTELPENIAFDHRQIFEENLETIMALHWE
jgi:ADP-ribose pyrophosphatase YjhB (NUDIX family)